MHAKYIVHVTNGWTTHLLASMREMIVPQAGSLHARNSVWKMGGYQFVIVPLHARCATTGIYPAAVDRGIPIMVHTREAEEDTDRTTNEIMRGPTSASSSTSQICT
ncbi:hypothetical protein ARMGADRAFT_1040501 [Armillaria gallica]|uniref:Uncharacterized protein n=1 Tax=Armillaria gallica TaxID=47427 RepID=A0A2H3C9V5_ARMGA|nr:hypothetical protein ARMGADRAFT_1040501 [Armillaria gallica]